MSKKEKLEQVLKSLVRVGDVEGAAIVTRDGLLIVSNLSQDVNADTFAAMAATMTGAAETAISELKKGLLQRVIAESREGKLISRGAGPNAVLVTMLLSKANLGLVLLEMDKATKKIEKELEGSSSL